MNSITVVSPSSALPASADDAVLVTVCVPQDPVAAADEAGLNYVHDTDPGVTRRRSGTGFSYRDQEGRPLRDAAALERIRKLVLPPAWTQVWICADPQGHIQATGLDARGRKQYRYHDRWRSVRDENKFGRMLAFGTALPALRVRIEHDLGLPGLPREKVLAAVVRLLDTTFIRIGNDRYARDNKSFGLTTLRKKHVTVEGTSLKFEFRAKSGKLQSVGIRDRRLARIVKTCQELPGQELFKYLDADGKRHDVTSSDVNAYLHEITGAGFSAKDFRTWAGTVLAALTLHGMDPAETPTAAKRNVVSAVKQVAQRLNNTPTVCRQCYIHPKVLDHYMGGTLADLLAEALGGTAEVTSDGFHPDEVAILGFLRYLEANGGVAVEPLPEPPPAAPRRRRARDAVSPGGASA